MFKSCLFSYLLLEVATSIIQVKSDLIFFILFQFNMLRYTGGSRERDCVYRCLEKIFTNYLAQFFSWTGKKNNFKLSSLKVMTTLKRKFHDRIQFLIHA